MTTASVSTPLPSICRKCENPTYAASGLCPEHAHKFAQHFKPKAASPVYATPRWVRLSKSMREEWVRENGWTCPGWRRGSHDARDLTLDHVHPLIFGGSPYDRSNLRVLCRSCQARKSLSQRRRSTGRTRGGTKD